MQFERAYRSRLFRNIIPAILVNDVVSYNALLIDDICLL